MLTLQQIAAAAVAGGLDAQEVEAALEYATQPLLRDQLAMAQPDPQLSTEEAQALNASANPNGLVANYEWFAEAKARARYILADAMLKVRSS